MAGKTGTAQAWDAHGNQGITASFIGVAPADNPRIAVAVILHNPRSSIYGGEVAAPVFSDVAGYTLGELGRGAVRHHGHAVPDDVVTGPRSHAGRTIGQVRPG